MPTVSIGVRIPQELYDWLKSKSEVEHRTLSNTIIAILLDIKKEDKTYGN